MCPYCSESLESCHATDSCPGAKIRRLEIVAADLAKALSDSEASVIEMFEHAIGKCYCKTKDICHQTVRDIYYR